MNKLVIFDLDGVLVSTKDLHYDALNEAILNVAGDDYVISRSEHLSIYDGRPTKTKLEMIHELKGMPRKYFNEIDEKKKEYTGDLLDEHIKIDKKLINIFEWLKSNDYKIAVASNSIRSTVVACLTNLGLIKLVDYFQSNEDIKYKKPHPEIYWNCIVYCGSEPSTTLIIEDSAIGRIGAKASGAKYWLIGNMDELNQKNLEKHLKMDKRIANWDDDLMTVLIPMAGEGSRFSQQGYTFPKPLIDVRGKPMIQLVVENLGIKANYVFIVRKEHYEKYNLKYMLNMISPGCKIIQADSLTEGAACTTMLAKEYLNRGHRLIIANSDQFIEWNPTETLYSWIESGIDGGILTFKSTHPKWSFAKVDDDTGLVTEVAEKKPISDNATVGVYYWKNDKDYVKYTEQMIQKNIRFNNEFYIAPVYNQAIEDGKKISIREIDNMWGIGTPEDLNFFLNNYEGKI